MTTPTLREAATDALRIFDWLARRSIYGDTDMAAVHANLRAALAQPVPDAALHTAVRLVLDATPEQLPMALDALRDHAGAALVAHPQQPARVPLTLEQINRIEMATEWPEGSLRNIGPRDWGRLLVCATRAIEAAHGIVPAPTTESQPQR